MANPSTPDPRVARTRDVVLAAVLAELAEVGHAAFTIESVAARCGVGKSTIYRHWDGKADLIIDAMERLNTQPAPDADGTPPQRVRELLTHLAAAISSEPVGTALPALIEAAERDPRLRATFHAYAGRRREALTDAIADGVAQGSFGSAVPPDLAAQALAGAVFYARLMVGTTPDAAAIDDLVTTVLEPDRGR